MPPEQNLEVQEKDGKDGILQNGLGVEIQDFRPLAFVPARRVVEQWLASMSTPSRVPVRSGTGCVLL